MRSKAEEELARIQAEEELQRRREEQERLELEAKIMKVLSVIFGFILVVFIIALVVGTIKNQNTPKSSSPKASYSATITRSSPIDPATLWVSVRVTNTSNVSGEPDCTVRAQNPSGSYKGWDIFGLGRKIAPGGTDSFNARLTITNNGASYVTEATVSCK